MGKKYRRGGARQKQEPALHSRSQQRARVGSRIRRGQGLRIVHRIRRGRLRPARAGDLSSNAAFPARPANMRGGGGGQTGLVREAIGALPSRCRKGCRRLCQGRRPACLGNNKRCFPSMRELKRTVTDGLLGDILHIEGNFSNEHSTRVKGGWRDDPRESPGGGMTGAGLHVLDAFVNLAGPIVKVDARVFSQKPRPDPRDAAAALVQFRCGATGVLGTVRAAPMFWRIHVFGTKGSAEARDETSLTLSLIGGSAETKTYAGANSLGVLLEAFAETVETGKPFPVSTSEMVDVVSAFEAMIRSIGEERPVAVT
jgi:predicted dehydrogenase